MDGGRDFREEALVSSDLLLQPIPLATFFGFEADEKYLASASSATLVQIELVYSIFQNNSRAAKGSSCCFEKEQKVIK